MADVEYNVFLVPGSTPTVVLSENETIDVTGAKAIGVICHPCTQDPLGWSGNHVLYHHIKEMLYKVKPDGTAGFWPDTITDLSRLVIKNEAELTEPEEPVIPDPTPDTEPVNTVLPVVSGTAKVSEVLTSTAGTWTGSPTPELIYQWQVSANGTDGWSNITDATTSTYTVDAADETKFIRCTVAATNSEGTVNANSVAVGPVEA